MSITKGQFIAAVEQNGYTQGFGGFFHDDNKDKIVSACAVGQGFLNLGVEWLPSAYSTDFATIRLAIHMNDTKKSIKKIVAFLKKQWKGYESDILYEDSVIARKDWGLRYENYQGVKVL